MAHHSSQRFDELDEELRGMMEDAIPDKQDEADRPEDSAAFGATGKHPEGKLTEEDEGKIQFGVAEKDGKVVLNFGKKVHWIAATPQQAKDLAGSLLNKAREAAE